MIKQILYLMLLIPLCISCGDSWSDDIYSIDNRTQYDIILYFHIPDNISGLEDLDSILCPLNQETIIEQMTSRSVKQLSCRPYVFKDYVELVVDGGNKHLIKDVSDDNNWVCTGEKDKSFIMVGSYYRVIKNSFIITENDLE